MKIYSESKTVKAKQIDELNHVNNVVYVKWIQDIAKKHWKFATTKEIFENYFWILLEHNVIYKKPAVLGDNLLIKTFILEGTGVKSKRCVEFWNKDTNVLLVKSVTTWCLFNTKTNKPNRITAEISNCFL